MLTMKIWMLRRQTAFQLTIILLLFLVTGCYEVYTRNNFTFSWILLQILGVLLAVFCFRFLQTSKWYLRHEHLRKRIISEYNRIICRQSYKIDRLSDLEKEIFEYIIRKYSLEEIVHHTGLTYERLFLHIAHIQRKLEVPAKEGLMEFNLADEIL